MSGLSFEPEDKPRKIGGGFGGLLRHFGIDLGCRA
jgi:hypothetical protein